MCLPGTVEKVREQSPKEGVRRIDRHRRAESVSDAMLTVDDLSRYERRHGHIPNGALVCMDSGWAAKVDDPPAFKGLRPALPCDRKLVARVSSGTTRELQRRRKPG